MKYHTVPENLLKLAVEALRFQATEIYKPGVKHITEEWQAADALEQIMKNPAAQPHVAKTHRPAHNI
jgi:hypothetical protein